MEVEVNEKTRPLVIPLRYIRGFVVVTVASTFFIGILLYGFGSYNKDDGITISWVLQRAFLMGIATAVGWVIGKLPLKAETRRKILVFSAFVGIGFLLLILSAGAYVFILKLWAR